MPQTAENSASDLLFSIAAGSESANQDDAPVTTLVVRKIKPEHRAQFERALVDLKMMLENQPGFQEIKAYRPGPPDHEHKIAFSFANAASLADWQQSPTRQKWLEGVKPLEAKASHAQIHSGNQNWFALPEKEGLSAPPPLKLALVTWMGIYPIVTLTEYLISPHLESLPVWLSCALTSALLVTLMNKYVLPYLTRKMGRFLYPEVELPGRGD